MIAVALTGAVAKARAVRRQVPPSSRRPRSSKPASSNSPSARAEVKAKEAEQEAQRRAEAEAAEREAAKVAAAKQAADEAAAKRAAAKKVPAKAPASTSVAHNTTRRPPPPYKPPVEVRARYATRRGACRPTSPPKPPRCWATASKPPRDRVTQRQPSGRPRRRANHWNDHRSRLGQQARLALCRRSACASISSNWPMAVKVAIRGELQQLGESEKGADAAKIIGGAAAGAVIGHQDQARHERQCDRRHSGRRGRCPRGKAHWRGTATPAASQLHDRARARLRRHSDGDLSEYASKSELIDANVSCRAGAARGRRRAAWYHAGTQPGPC